MRNFLLFAPLVWGCVGTIEGTGGIAAGPGDVADAAPGPSGDSPGVDAAGSTNPLPDGPTTAFACRNKVVAGIGSGQHNAGQDCQQGCHDHGFTFSGTLYANAAGSAPLVGATITAVDAAGVTIDVVSQANGNFYTSKAVTFPLTVTASACPDVQPMISKVAAGGGGCLKSGCHAAGATGPIHLP